MSIRIFAAVISCLLNLGVLTASVTDLTIPETKTPPILDGALTDNVWQNAAKIEELYSLNSEETLKDTTVYLLRNNKWLYLGFACTNSNMPHITQTAFKHDDNYSKLHSNESVEIYIRPDKTKDLYYWFVLSFANIRFEQRLHAPPNFERSIAWNAPWRSSTQRLQNGWSAEVAIPLYALRCDDLSGMAINIARNAQIIEVDESDAVQGKRTVLSALKACNRSTTHHFKNFVPVSGLGLKKPEKPFTPAINPVQNKFLKL